MLQTTQADNDEPVCYLFRFTEDLPYMKCPLHTILKLTPVAYGKSLPDDRYSVTT